MRSSLPVVLLVGTFLILVGIIRISHADEVITPQQFATSASIDNLFELEAAKLAQQRALNNDTKAFASDMIRDHTPAGETIANAARSQGIVVPTILDEVHQQKLDALKVVPSDGFDQAYLSTQVTAHEEGLRLFQSYAKSGPDSPLRNAANAILPTMKMHSIRIHGLASPT